MVLFYHWLQSQSERTPCLVPLISAAPVTSFFEKLGFTAVASPAVLQLVQVEGAEIEVGAVSPYSRASTGEQHSTDTLPASIGLVRAGPEAEGVTEADTVPVAA